MNVLVVNIGSTSFKFRLFDMNGEQELARGSVEGIGRPASRVTLRRTGAAALVREQHVPDQAAAVELCLAALRTAGPDGAPLAFDAVGFKAVHGGHLADAVRVTPDVIAIMEQFTEAAPAHNPAYVAAMRAFERQMPDLPRVAAFETGFHQTVPLYRAAYAIPYDWTERFGVRRYGFHGASHRFVATRVAELLGRDDLCVISCHLGGSSSLCAIERGRSVANSFGMTPQSGLPQNNRVGDFDAYALLLLTARTRRSADELLAVMSREGGLLGLSGISNDMPAVLAAAERGVARAELAVAAYVDAIRHYLGAYVIALGGLDVLVFTGGIGERSAGIRARVCRGLEFLGITLDAARNERGGDGAIVSGDASSVKILTLQTNEELIVARQTQQVLQTS